jgi:hypothetical protein
MILNEQEQQESMESTSPLVQDAIIIAESTTKEQSFIQRYWIMIWLAIFAFFYITDPSQPFLVEYFSRNGISTEIVC